jgi:hypothetical protein
MSFTKLLPPNNDVETSEELKFEFNPPFNWVWSERAENLDAMPPKGTKRSNEAMDLQELNHQLFDKVLFFLLNCVQLRNPFGL